jgi:hypothetical protein
MDNFNSFERAQKRTAAWLAEHDLVGLTLDEASTAASEAGILVRVVATDQEDIWAITADHSARRVNVEIAKGRISRVNGPY